MSAENAPATRMKSSGGMAAEVIPMREERTTRLCTKCGVLKRTDEFPWRTSSGKGRRFRRRWCRDCCNAGNREFFAGHPDVRKKAYRDYWNKDDPRYAQRLLRSRALAKKTKLLNYAFMDAEKARGCLDCGERDWRVLQFDHVRGKTANLATLSRCSTRTFLAELDRCEVVCANCHARRTYSRRLVTHPFDRG